jgi:outer membrane protein OmpA-like peptidoglycan-associated protein
MNIIEVPKWKSVITVMVLVLALGSMALAETARAEGQIKTHDGDTMIIQTSSSPSVTVLLNETTQIKQLHGVLKLGRKDRAKEDLIPGLRVQVQGAYNEQQQIVAKLIKFDSEGMEDARAIQAGVFNTQMQGQQNKEELLKQNAALQAQNESLKAQQEQLVAQQQQMTAQQQEIQKNRAVIDAAIARFGQLPEYYILNEVTVLFKNGQSKVDPKYIPELNALAKQAKTIKGYTIQVEGYASAVGSSAVNQKLSERRAENVKAVLLQDGNIPSTYILAPGAMGESRQVGDNKGAKGQAENRRVIVRVLQSKGIAGV